jgi:hypothetical protein
MPCHLDVLSVECWVLVYSLQHPFSQLKISSTTQQETLKMLQRSLEIKLTKCPWTSLTTIVAWALGQTCDVFHIRMTWYCILRPHKAVALYLTGLRRLIAKTNKLYLDYVYYFSYYTVTRNLASDHFWSCNLKMCMSCDHKFVDNLHCRLAIQHNSRKLMWRFASKNPAWRNFSRKKREMFVTKFTLLLLKVVVSFLFGWTQIYEWP